MQSSTTAACRAGVILICLIAIPLAALFGTKLPGLVSWLVEREQDAASVSNEDLRCEAPPFGRAVATTSASDRPIAPAWGGAPTRSPPATPLSGESPEGSESPGRSPAPAPTHYLGDLSRRSGPQLLPVSIGPHSEGAVAVSPAVLESDPTPLVRVAPTDWREESLCAEGAVAYAAGRRNDRAMAAQPFVETPQSKEILERLRELSASYYALETWGAQGQYFRFHARIAAGHGGSYVRHFDAVDRSGDEAMGSVLDQVEQWRAGQGRLEPTSSP